MPAANGVSAASILQLNANKWSSFLKLRWENRFSVALQKVDLMRDASGEELKPNVRKVLCIHCSMHRRYGAQQNESLRVLVDERHDCLTRLCLTTTLAFTLIILWKDRLELGIFIYSTLGYPLKKIERNILYHYFCGIWLFYPLEFPQKYNIVTM